MKKKEVIKTFPRSNTSIRLEQSIEVLDYNINNIRITKTIFGDPTGLPKFQNGIFYIVSQLVKSALSHRGDLLVPAEIKRDEKGNIVGCLSLGL